MVKLLSNRLTFLRDLPPQCDAAQQIKLLAPRASLPVSVPLALLVRSGTPYISAQLTRHLLVSGSNSGVRQTTDTTPLPFVGIARITLRRRSHEIATNRLPASHGSSNTRRCICV